MKNFCLLSVFLLCSIFAASAKTFYISANGNDNNIGTSSAAPWKSIAKLNASFSLISAGDSILFRRGDVFYGAIVVGKSGASGNPIVISAYGTGNKPVITGFVTASGWTSVSGGIYQASFPGAKSTLNMVVLNNQPQALGRYPNADAANGGYLNYESHSGSTSITDNQLTTSTNWVGAEVVIRKKLWVLDRCKVTAHSGGTLTFTNIGSTYEGTNGYGYFFQNDVRTLDKAGEWYFNNGTKRLQMFFGTASPSSYSVKAACIDTLLIMSGKNYITVSNVSFDGANANALFINGGTNVSILNCDITNAGSYGINVTSTANVLIENCTTNYCLSNGICVNSARASNITIRGNSVKNTGTIPGMGISSGNSYKGITSTALSNLLIEYNRVDTTGYVGIEFQGSNVNVRYNVVNYFDFIKDDAGGIYSYAGGTDASPGTTYTNRTVSNNIVMNGAGAPNGRNSSSLFVTGIYMDGRTMNVNILNNTVFNNGKNGIHCNNPNGVTVKGNTSYNNLNAMSVMRWANIGTIKNFAVKNNIFYPKLESQRVLYYTNSGLNEPVSKTVNSDLAALGSIDSNTYHMVNPTGFNFEIYGSTGGSLIQTTPYSFEGWNASTTHDIRGKKPAKTPMPFKITGLVGSNKFTNSLFNTAISGLTLFGSGTSVLWDNTNKISGGSLKMVFSTPAANKYSLLHGPIGAVSASKKYVVRLSTYGTTPQGIVRIYLRKTTSPYNNLVTTQVRTFSSGRNDHEFLVDAPTTATAASLCIEIEQTSGTTYIDNVAMYEATATLYNTDQQIRFEYNDTRNTKAVSLDAAYYGVDGVRYTGTITLQPFSSLILVKDTGTTTAPAPTAPATTSLKATAIAAPVSCYGSGTSVTVSASGGTAPYTGTGTFTANAGRGAAKITFPSASAGKFMMMYYTVGAISSSKNYALRFTTLGTTANGKLRAAIRQTYTPWAAVTEKQTANFGTARQDHEFIFRAPATQASASFLIEIDQASGTTYIDNIAFFECDSSGTLVGNNLYSDGQIEANISKLFFYSDNNNHAVSWDNTGKITSNYYYTVTDATGKKVTAPVTIQQPAAPLTVTATSGLITVLNGLTNVVVSATGGTAPYSGTGSFSVLAGTYSYTVTDAKGCTASATVSVLPFTSAKPVSSTSSGTSARVMAPTSSSVTPTPVTATLQMQAYPNPSAGAFNLSLQGGTDERVVIQVFSIDGRMVYQTSGNSNSRYTFGDTLMDGIYILKVTQGADVQSLKVVKASR